MEERYAPKNPLYTHILKQYRKTVTMKSIMEEASSLTKAIEKGWIRAGKPQEFTVKVFEEAKKNFFGFTVKSAKIALFFQEQVFSQPSRHQKNAPQPAAKRFQTHSEPQPQAQTRQQPQARPLPTPVRQERAPRTEAHTSATPWSPELTDAAQEWVKDSLKLMNLSHIDFTVEADRYALKFSFKKPLNELNEKEKMLFRSWAYLIMQALRQKFKRPLKGLKVILTSNT